MITWLDTIFPLFSIFLVTPEKDNPLVALVIHHKIDIVGQSNIYL